MRNTRTRPTEKAEREYVAIVGCRTCVVTGAATEAELDWAHFDDRPHRSRGLDVVRLRSNLNGALNRARHPAELPAAINPDQLRTHAERLALEGRFGRAYACARLGTYIAMPNLRRAKVCQGVPGDASLSVTLNARSLANARVIGRADVAADVLERDSIPLAHQSDFRHVDPALIAGILTQIGGFYRDAGDVVSDEWVERLALRLTRRSTADTRALESVSLRNNAIRHVEAAAVEAECAINDALAISGGLAGTEHAAQLVWSGAARLSGGDLDGAVERVDQAARWARARIVPLDRDRGFDVGIPLGGLTYQSLFEGLVIRGVASELRGGRYRRRGRDLLLGAVEISRRTGIVASRGLGATVIGRMRAVCAASGVLPATRPPVTTQFDSAARGFICRVQATHRLDA